MLPRPLAHRRGRRTDLDAIAAILSASGVAPLADDRAALRRFRQLIADLGADFYVAMIDDRVVGLVHVTYTRHLLEGQQARIELLAVAPDARRRGVGASLLALAGERAARRNCRRLRIGAALDAAGHAFLQHAGWRPHGEQLQIDLARVTR